MPTFKNQEIPHKNPDFRLLFKNPKIWEPWVCIPSQQLALLAAKHTPAHPGPAALLAQLRWASEFMTPDLILICSCSGRQAILQHLRGGCMAWWEISLGLWEKRGPRNHLQTQQRKDHWPVGASRRVWTRAQTQQRPPNNHRLPLCTCHSLPRSKRNTLSFSFPDYQARPPFLVFWGQHRIATDK